MSNENVHPIFKGFIDSLTNLTKPVRNPYHPAEEDKIIFERHQLVKEKATGRRAVCEEDSYHNWTTVIRFLDGREETTHVDNKYLELIHE